MNKYEQMKPLLFRTTCLVLKIQIKPRPSGPCVTPAKTTTVAKSRRGGTHGSRKMLSKVVVYDRDKVGPGCSIQRKCLGHTLRSGCHGAHGTAQWLAGIIHTHTCICTGKGVWGTGLRTVGGAQQFLQGHSSNYDTEVGLGREMPLPPTLPGSSPETQRAVPGEREETEHVLASSPAWWLTLALGAPVFAEKPTGTQGSSWEVSLKLGQSPFFSLLSMPGQEGDEPWGLRCRREREETDKVEIIQALKDQKVDEETES